MIGKKFGQYRVIERLGSGGMGKVYRAADELLERDVALKVLDTTMEEGTARFRAEAAALARLSHPGIAMVYELVEDDGNLVMAMEYVRGQSLQQILEQVGVFSARRAAELCMLALAALQHAHAAGVVHRDLKPGNLMLTESGGLKILDFGIARLDGGVNLTSVGTMLGTPAYMAPEQVLGHAVDARTDLYAMGIVLFRLVTGALPFKASTPFDMAQAQVNGTPSKARDERPDLPEWVDEILARALAKKPGDRFQSAMELHEAFALAIAQPHEPDVIRVPEFTEVMPRPVFDPPSVLPEVVAPDVAQEASPEAAIRSDISVGAAVDAAAPAAPKQIARAKKPVVPRWVAPAAAVVLAGTVWMIVPRRSAPPAAPNDLDASAITSVPPPDSASPAPDQGGALAAAPAASSTGPTVTRAALTTDAAANRGAKAPKPAATTPAPADEVSSLPPLSFHDVKMLAVSGNRASTSDVMVHFSATDVTLRDAAGKAAPATLPYARIAKATYASGRDPKWDPALSAPAEKIDVPGMPGILGRTRRWLVLQSAESYVILRLDGPDWRDVIKAFEERARMTVDRPADSK